MEKKMFYVVVGYCGRLLRTPGNQKYGYSDRIVPVKCTEDELETVATAIGKGYLADACVVYDNPECSRHEKPYAVYWDCM